MDRAWKSGASATPPTAPAAPSIGYPTEGDPGTGVPPTKPGAFWYYAQTEELRNIIVAAGLTPSPAAVNQVKAALDLLYVSLSLFTGSNQSLTANGYQKLPGGLILQWCSGAPTTAEGSQTITFPLTFPNACLGAFPSVQAAAAAGAYDTWYQLLSKTASNCVIYAQQPTSNSNSCTPLILAVGY